MNKIVIYSERYVLLVKIIIPLPGLFKEMLLIDLIGFKDRFICPANNILFTCRVNYMVNHSR